MVFVSHTQSSVAVAYADVLVYVAAALVFGLVPVLVWHLVAVESHSYPFASAFSGAPASCFPVYLLDFHSHSDCAFAGGVISVQPDALDRSVRSCFLGLPSMVFVAAAMVQWLGHWLLQVALLWSLGRSCPWLQQ